MKNPSFTEIVEFSEAIAKDRVLNSSSFDNGLATKFMDELHQNPKLKAHFANVNPVDFIMGVEAGILYTQANAGK